MSNKIPTAEEFLFKLLGELNEDSKVEYLSNNPEYLKYYCGLIREQINLHVKAALEAAVVNVRTTCLADRFLDDYDSSKDAEGDIFTKDSILNAYPENLIL